MAARAPAGRNDAGLLIAGASGLVGRELARLAALDKTWQPLNLIVRRPLVPPPGAQTVVVDFATLPHLPKAANACCALGTTMASAGSQEAFRAVDLEAVLAFARAAQRAGVRHFATVSSLGANARSGNFYSRIKGEAEDALCAMGFESLIIARPSLLAGDRAALAQASRPGERLALAFAKPLAGLIPKAWRPIEPQTVAQAMLVALRNLGPGEHLIESAQLHEWGGQASA